LPSFICASTPIFWWLEDNKAARELPSNRADPAPLAMRTRLHE
jgi:hypothetical protein